MQHRSETMVQVTDTADRLKSFNDPNAGKSQETTGAALGRTVVT